MKKASCFLLSWIAATHAATCYYPDGSTAKGMSPCPGSKTCCKDGTACLANRLCFGPNLGIIYRGSCTDKNWPEAYCPNTCFDNYDSFAYLFQCPDNEGSSSNMTCSSYQEAYSACDDPDGFHTWVSGGKVTEAEIGQNNTSEANTTTTPTPVPTTDANSTVVTQTAKCDESASSSTSPVALGAGLGVGLGVPLLLTTALLIYFVSSRRQLSSSTPTEIEPTRGGQAPPSEMGGGSHIPPKGSDAGTRSELPGSSSH